MEVSGRKPDSQWPIWMKPGVRVVRGPDWMATIRDPKSVDLGTLSYVPKNAANNKVQVVWDNGQERSYKSGYNGEYELRAFDLQQVGIQHQGKKCSECSMNPLRGIRFHCPKCSTDICVMCYMTDKHATDHPFVRFDTPQSDKVNLPPRKSSKSLQLMGVFVNTTVIRGPHWSQTSIDGETGTGEVKAFVEERNGCGNAYIKVKWEIGKEIKEYRFGAGGFVDVIAAKCVCGGKCYVDHLPVIGIVKLKNGDKVSVHMGLTEFKDAQTKAKVPEGWKDEMKQCLNEIGTVVDLLFDGNMANIQYPNGNVHIVCTAALNRKSSFRKGNAAKMINDKKMLQKLQEGHGGYSSQMDIVLGKVGRILQVQPDGDVKILFDKKRFTFNPTCLTLVEDQEEAKTAPDMPSSDGEKEEEEKQDVTECDSVPGKKLRRKEGKDKDKESRQAFSDGFLTTMSGLKTNQDLSSLSSAMFDAFASANIDEVIKIVTKHKNLLKEKTDGKTIVHLACHEGYDKLVCKLIELGADMSDKDDEGDTPLHYATYGKQPDCVQQLLQGSADPNIKNNLGVTPLMIAVSHPDIDSIKYLVLNNADVSIQNSDMETAMHDAVSQKEMQPMIVQTILASKTANFNVCNNECFNVLHYAVYNNNLTAVKIILDKCQSLVDVPMSSEGFTALHIAAANDYIEIASSLLTEGKANPNAQEKEKRTPLHIAVAQEHKRVIVLLLDNGADPNAQDDYGDTPLHLSQNSLKKMELTKSMRSKGPDINIAIVCTLLERGADLYVKNKLGLTPVDLITDLTMKGMIERLTIAYKKSPTKTQTGVKLPMHWSSIKLTEIKIVILDTMDTIQQHEYAEVEKQFRLTMELAVIVCIKRVQNPNLWEHYTLKKREMENRLGQGMANEQHLYHGTKPDLVEVIANDNFDFRIAGSNVGALYGQGAYFASTAKYSDLYASADPTSGNKSMFIAKVLVGKMCIGSSTLKRPPEIDKNDFKKGRYDSTGNSELNPTVFCVFDQNQYYPEYVVEYR